MEKRTNVEQMIKTQNKFNEIFGSNKELIQFMFTNNLLFLSNCSYCGEKFILCVDNSRTNGYIQKCYCNPNSINASIKRDSIFSGLKSPLLIIMRIIFDGFADHKPKKLISKQLNVNYRTVSFLYEYCWNLYSRHWKEF